MRRSIVLLVLLTTTSTGCSYLEARGNDFLGCFRCTVGAGVGVSNGWLEYTGLARLPDNVRQQMIRDIESLKEI